MRSRDTDAATRSKRDLIGKLHAASADATRGAEDQHGLAGPDLPARHHHAVRGAVGDRQCRGLSEADGVIKPDQHVGRHANILCQAAVKGFAEQSAIDAVDRIDEDAVARLEPLDRWPDRQRPRRRRRCRR